MWSTTWSMPPTEKVVFALPGSTVAPAKPLMVFVSSTGRGFVTLARFVNITSSRKNS